MIRHLCIQRADSDLGQKLPQSRRGDPSSPELPPDPITDSLFILALLPADEVTRDLLFIDDRARRNGLVPHNPLPMPHELAAIFGRIRRHGNGLRVELLLEEDGQVGGEDGADENFH